MQKYIDYAAEIYGIYLKYIDPRDIHTYSIDESFIDATDYLTLYNIRAKDFAKKLTGEIYETLGGEILKINRETRESAFSTFSRLSIWFMVSRQETAQSIVPKRSSSSAF